MSLISINESRKQSVLGRFPIGQLFNPDFLERSFYLKNKNKTFILEDCIEATFLKFRILVLKSIAFNFRVVIRYLPTENSLYLDILFWIRYNFTLRIIIIEDSERFERAEWSTDFVTTFQGQYFSGFIYRLLIIRECRNDGNCLIMIKFEVY